MAQIEVTTVPARVSTLHSRYTAGTDTTLTVEDAGGFAASGLIRLTSPDRVYIVVLQYSAKSGNTLTISSILESNDTRAETAVYMEGSEIMQVVCTGITAGGGGTTDYDMLSNRPEINGHTLTGDQTSAELELVPETRKVAGINLADDITVAEMETALTGLVPETRTVAGIDLADNITSSELEDALTGLVPKTRTVAGVDLADNITVAEMQTALKGTIASGNAGFVNGGDAYTNLVPKTRKVANIDLQDDITVAEMQTAVLTPITGNAGKLLAVNSGATNVEWKQVELWLNNVSINAADANGVRAYTFVTVIDNVSYAGKTIAEVAPLVAARYGINGWGVGGGTVNYSGAKSGNVYGIRFDAAGNYMVAYVDQDDHAVKAITCASSTFTGGPNSSTRIL